MSNQISGDHYQSGMQPIEYIKANDMRFDEGSVVKYITRHQRKAGLADVFKAIHNCLFVAERCYGLDEDTTKEIMQICKRKLEEHGNRD